MIISKYIFLLLSLFCVCTTIKGQSEINIQDSTSSDEDKLNNYIKEAVDYASQKKFDSANYYINNATLLSKEINSVKLIGKVKRNNALILYWQGDTRNAKNLLEENINNIALNDRVKFFSEILYEEIYEYEHNYKEAVLHLLNAEKLIRKSKTFVKRDSINFRNLYIRIGDLYRQMNLLEKAHEYYGSALLYNKDIGYQSWILHFVARLYGDKNEMKNSIRITLNAVEIAKKNNDKTFLPTYYLDLSNYYLKLKKGDSAVYYAKKGLYDNDYCQLDLLNTSLGKGYIASQKYEDAIYYFKKALTSSEGETSLEVHKSLSESYNKLKNYKKAIYHNTIYLKLKDSIDNLKIKQEVLEITEKYESEKKELKIEILQSENKHGYFVIQKQKSQLILISISLLLSITLLSFIMYFYFKQKKHKDLLFAKNRLLVLNNVQVLNNKPKNETVNIGELQKQKIHDSIKIAIQNEFYLDNNISLSSFAKTVNSNTSYLSKVINEDYRKTFTSFINELRITYTLKQLEILPEYRKLTIENIADKSGFTSSSAFYSAFKKFTGLTPSYYIKKRLRQEF